jgi:XTP/dITP diphosphohydrolase
LAQKVIARARANGLPPDLIPEGLRAVTIDPDHDAENDLRSAALKFMDAVRAAERAMAATRTAGETDATAERWRRVWCNP